MEKINIVEYVMRTPGNTNRAVLNSMLNELTSSQPSPTPSNIIWIEWNGDRTGRKKIDMGDGENFTYKIDDTVLSTEDLDRMYIITYDDGSRYIDTLSSEDATDLDGAILFNGEFACISGKAGEYHLDDWTIVIPEDGTYLPILNDHYYVNMLLKNKEN